MTFGISNELETKVLGEKKKSPKHLNKKKKLAHKGNIFTKDRERLA